MVKDYMKKQVMIQAVVWTGDNTHEITKFMAQGLCEVDDFQTGSKQLVIPTLEGDHRASIGDYIIKGVKGEFYPCKPDIFEMSYEEVEKCEGLPANDEWKRNRSFSTALDWLKRGEKISRKGWNGKNMFVVYQKGYPDGIPCNKNTAEAWGMKEGELFKCEPYLQIKMVNGSHAMWVPSINDVLSNDWEIYE